MIFNLFTDDKLMKVYHKINCNMTIDLNFFNNQLKKKRIHRKLFEKLSMIYDEMNNIYPDMWEMQIWPEYSNIAKTRFKLNVFPVIKFDRVTITNSNNKSTILQDLYVGICISTTLINNPKIDKFIGTRGIQSYPERSSGYLHSHLPGQNTSSELFPLFYSKFCKGSGGMTEAITMLNANFSAPLFKLMLLQINEYVRWESIEGGPHKRIENIMNKGIIASIKMSIDELRNVFSTVDRDLHINDFDILVIDGVYKICDNEKFSLLLGRILDDKYLVKVAEDGQQYPLVDTADNSLVSPHYTDVVWNKRKLKFVKLTLPIGNNTFERHPHKTVKKLIIKYLEAKLLKKILEYE